MTDLCCRVVELEGKGFGTLAARAIKRGEVVLQEVPLARARLPDNEEYGRVVREHIDRLSASERERFDELACPFSVRRPELTWQVNHFGVDGDEVVYCQISRLNHSCTPNCAHSFDRRRGCGQIKAIQDIGEGDELSLTYADLCAPRNERQAYLQRFYQFACQCPCCTAPEAAGETSDVRRALLLRCCSALAPRNEVVGIFRGGLEDDVPDAAVALAREARDLGLRIAGCALALVNAECLAGVSDKAAHVCEAAAYLLLGHPGLQRLWSDECLARMALGGSATDVEGMRDALDTIASQPAPPLLPQLTAERAEDIGEPPEASASAAAADAGGGPSEHVVEAERLLAECDALSARAAGQ